MRPLLPAIATLSLAVAAQAAWAANAGEVRKMPAFHAIEVSGAASVIAKVGGPQSVRLVGDKRVLDTVVTEVKKGTLRLYHKREPQLRFWERLQTASYRAEVTVPQLTGVSASGACSLQASGLKGDRFNWDASGACKATLAGKVKLLTADLSGACEGQAEQLAAERAELSLSGASRMAVRVAQMLKVDASGACGVTYLGKPKVEADLTGVSTVRAK